MTPAQLVTWRTMHASLPRQAQAQWRILPAVARPGKRRRCVQDGRCKSRVFWGEGCLGADMAAVDGACRLLAWWAE